MTLRLAVTGYPFSGKKTLAAKLAEEYKLTRFDVETLMAGLEKLINPPPVDEADAKKKPPAGKKDEP
jgi:tRNA uridine 5-carbamoylmethylation protein Kti12